MSKNWDSELKKIDRMLEGASDEALLPSKSAKTPQARAEIIEKQRKDVPARRAVPEGPDR